MRNLLEEWFSHYPAGEQKKLHRRFHSSKGNEYLSPFFELFLHELLSKMGCSITIHPKANDETENRPDFLVQAPDGKSFYLEAIAKSGESAVEKASKSRKSEIINAINRSLDSPNFLLKIDVIKEGNAAPPARGMVKFLADELKKLDPDKVAEQLKSSGLNSLPIFEYTHQDWKINFSPIPKSKERRGKTRRAIGLIWDGAKWIDPRIHLLKALKTKAGRYKDIDLPYVIAVNEYDDFLDGTDTVEGLYGQVGPWSNSVSSEMRREANGFWTSQNIPTNTRVSAVLIGTPVLPINLESDPVRLYHNPWAKLPYSSILNRLPQHLVEDDHFVKKDGESIGSIFGLPANWPH